MTDASVLKFGAKKKSAPDFLNSQKIRAWTGVDEALIDENF